MIYGYSIDIEKKMWELQHESPTATACGKIKSGIVSDARV